MTDALCGPSNPLQSFQKHTAVDRTLQQDRLHSAASPVQGFRSIDPRQGSLDNEFAAFEAGQPFQPLAQPPLPLDAIRHGPVSSKPLPLAGGSSWASDFQNLRLNEPSHPIPQSQFRHEAPLQRSHVGQSGWHGEFMRQQQNRQVTSISAPQQPAYTPQYAFANSTPAINGFLQDQMPPLSEQQEYHPAQQASDDAAFEQAFASVESNYLEEVDSTAKGLEEEHESRTLDEEHIMIGSDLIYERKPPENLSEEKAEADDLARTAGDLLNALRHDTSDKFQQSQFLSLMRMIRDREVEVKDNDFAQAPSNSIPTSDTQQPLHPGGRYYPEQSPPPVLQQQTSMSGGISGNDLDHFDKVSESRSLADRFAPRDDAAGGIQLTNGIAFRQESESTA